MKLIVPGMPVRRAPSDDVSLANHFFFATAMAFAIHQYALNPELPRNDVVFVAQSLNLQPRVPPPYFEPEQVSQDFEIVAE